MADEISSMLSSIDLQDDTNSDSSAEKLPSSIDGKDSNSSSPKSIDAKDSDSSSPEVKTPRSINSGDRKDHASALPTISLTNHGAHLDFGHVSSLKMPDLIKHGDRKDPGSALSPKTTSLTNHEAHLDFGPVSSLKMPDLISPGIRKDSDSASPHGSVSSAGSAGSDDSVDCSTVCTMIQLQAADAFSRGKLKRTNPNRQTPSDVEVNNLPSLLLQNFNTGWGLSIDEVGPLNSVDIGEVLRIVGDAFEMAGKFLDSVQDASAKLLINGNGGGPTFLGMVPCRVLRRKTLVGALSLRERD